MNFPEIMLLDFIYFALIFGAFYLTVAVCRFFFCIIKEKLKPKRTPVKRRSRKKVSPVRSIEINPDEVDKIYVKKIS